MYDLIRILIGIEPLPEIQDPKENEKSVANSDTLSVQISSKFDKKGNRIKTEKASEKDPEILRLLQKKSDFLFESC